METLDDISNLPESVRDSKLPAEIHYEGGRKIIVHPRSQTHRARRRQDRWVRREHLGSGGQGMVDLQAREPAESTRPQYRAVKTIPISDRELRSERASYMRELEALAKFSQAKVSSNTLITLSCLSQH
jgi:hypothetical protein